MPGSLSSVVSVASSLSKGNELSVLSLASGGVVSSGS